MVLIVVRVRQGLGWFHLLRREVLARQFERLQNRARDLARLHCIVDGLPPLRRVGHEQGYVHIIFAEPAVIRDFRGEAVENLTGAGEYHWMAGNFMKYGAEEATFGRKTAGDIPVDAHELIALCAPRPTFVSYGVPERGDARWLDHQGSYMAAVASQPAFRLLGAKGLGVSDDYQKEKMPAVNVDLLDGQLAWRQHDGGHTDGPNWKYFIPWANRFLK